MQQSIFNSFNENILPHHGEIRLYDHFFDSGKANFFFEKLQNTIHWKQEPIWIFGKKVMQPRLTALYGDPEKTYSYSGITMNPIPWTAELLEIKSSVEQVVEKPFTHVLLNFYRDGQDSMGWHRDNESTLGPNPVIASVSFGVSRNFQIRNYFDKSEKIQIPLNHGSLLIMQGESQHHWEHQIPKSKKVAGGRINLTFRKLI
ncbi:alpha-ketoglutarate-dependent dioxygenase AlkB family protein [Algoriphagus limi]|uniref:Alpha-ketoglutarate-dependent dioxygenase AlkB n=1 Tax=Algoriphagus limi TaxID=2975273 RepID=A0ABT2G665_9BACT|nr:alpha-ketoglutarate-dependent dioxygenase AlkB [Algoriphagus limi]MCS5490268.1 alpha-ketoglutarate-dependent dioxygenase AlkB [Algoriphagus limi]